MSLDQLLEQLKGLAAEAGFDARSFASKLKSTAPTLYQQVYNIGHSDAHQAGRAAAQALEERLGKEVQELKLQLATASEEKRALERKLGAGSPDAEALEKARREHAEELQKVQASAKEREEKLTKRYEAERDERHKAQLRAALGGVDEAWQEVLVERAWKRVSYDEEGRPVVSQRGLTIPVQPADGKSHLDFLAEEILADVPASARTGTARGGSGSLPGTGGPGAPAHLEAARKSGQEAAKAQQTQVDTSLAFK
ncbi:MAG: hypothetical protein R3247_06690 [Rhodothermales bacterium]|nr:hypothetical protein [Rhodothermales bacterium]